ncbi:MAG: phosphoglycerate mutase (2,3-diphosphoglycerate-independent) [Clostridia bacterium]
MKEIKERGGRSLAMAVEAAYARGAGDYAMPPLVAQKQNGTFPGKIQDGDSVVFCCRRGEREIELTEMFTDPTFSAVERKPLQDLFFVTLTLYHEKFRDLSVAFQPQRLEDTLAQAVSQAGKTQFHCAESEKFAHITFFLNGGNHQPVTGETDVCIPTVKGIPFEKQPAMRIYDVTEAVVDALDQYDLIAVNFANGDVIGHTASCSAKLETARHISQCLKRLTDEAKKHGYVTLVTADHGNLERMLTPKGTPDVAHTTNPVPFVLIDPQTNASVKLKDGLSLSSVAPTILQIMGIEKPDTMTAESLLTAPLSSEGRKAVLVILDGWGMGEQDETNPIYLGETEPWKTLLSAHPHTLLSACGTHVGLGTGKPGNSEAGHMNLGAGRMVPQDDQRLEASMGDGSFEQNPVFLEAIANAKRHNKALHLISYLSHKSSHGEIGYALKLCAMAKELEQVYLHVIFDGRSTESGSAPAMLRELDEALCEIGQGMIVDGIGRGYVLDRDHNWEKVKQGYDAMVLGAGMPYELGE